MNRLTTFLGVLVLGWFLAYGSGASAQAPDGPGDAEASGASQNSKKSEREKKRLERRKQQLEKEKERLEERILELGGSEPTMSSQRDSSESDGVGISAPDAATQTSEVQPSPDEAPEQEEPATIKLRWGGYCQCAGCCPVAAVPPEDDEEEAVRRPAPQEDEETSPDIVDFRFGIEAVMLPAWGPYFTLGMQLYDEHLLWVEGGFGWDQIYDFFFGSGVAYAYRLDISSGVFAALFGAGVGYWFSEEDFESDFWYSYEDDEEWKSSNSYFFSPMVGVTTGDFGDVFGVDLFFRMPIGEDVLPILTLGLHVTL